MYLLPPAAKLGQGYIFTGVCDSVHIGGLPQCMLGYHHPPDQAPPRSRHPPVADTPAPLGADTPPGADTPGSRHPPEQTPTPPGADTPQTRHSPWCRACWEIWSMRGQYASYWNAILLSMPLVIIFGISAPKMVEGGQLRNVQKLMKNV